LSNAEYILYSGGDPAITFNSVLIAATTSFWIGQLKKNVLSRASEKASPARYVRESPYNYDYMRGYIPVGTYTNMYGDPVMAYMEAGMVYGSKA